MLNRHITLCLHCIKAYLPRMVEVAKDFKGGNQTDYTFPEVLEEAIEFFNTLN